MKSTAETIERIANSLGSEVAVVIRNNHVYSDVCFPTSPEDLFQIGFLKRPAGHVVAAHYHPVFADVISEFTELIHVKTGAVKVTIIERKTLDTLATIVLKSGDTLVQKKEAHKLEFLTETELLEVKQGPYHGSKSKVFISTSTD